MLGERNVHLYADLRRWLPVTDADGRDLVVSCGAALHHLRVALAASGFVTDVHRFPNPDQPDHIAAVELHRSASREQDVELTSAIARRRTDRRRFTDWEVPEGFLDELVAQAAEQGALLRPVSGSARAGLIDAIREAGRLQEGEALPDGDGPVERAAHGRGEGTGREPAAGLRGHAATPPGS